MAFLKVGGEVPSKKQRLYIMEFDFSGKLIYKIGKSSGHSSKNRLLEIAGSYFDKYRVTPAIRIVRDQVCEDVFTKETGLHHFFKSYQYHPVVPFSGSTEMFELDRAIVVQAYEAMLDGCEVPSEPYVHPDDILPF